jgi:hypothetical protein
VKRGPTEQDELDLDRLVCESRCSVGHWMGLLESGAGDKREMMVSKVKLK